MRRPRLALLALFMSTAIPGAPVQAQTVLPLRPDVLMRVSADDVVERMMSFDCNGDRKVEKAELPERMHHLVSRGDADRDGALDADEFLRLANAPPAGAGKVSRSGSYGFADETSLSSRLHIEDVLEDLRLAGPARARASAVAMAYVDTLEASALADLTTRMTGLLTTEQLADFKVALATRGPGRITVSREGPTRIVVVGRPEVDAGRRLDSYLLPPAQSAQAHAALTEYKARLRLRDRERSELVAELKSVLDAEELDNFRAALARRPVVAQGDGEIRVKNVFLGRVPVLKVGTEAAAAAASVK